MLIDLLATREFYMEAYPDKYYPGYLQQVSLFPFMIQCYNEKSLKLFRKIAKENRVTLFLDDTSNVSQPMEDVDDRRIFYYALVIKNKGKSVPILEFFLALQDFQAIMYSLETFFHKYVVF